MKGKQTIAFLLIILGTSISLSAQVKKGTWQVGFGAGLNTIQYKLRSSAYSLVVSGYTTVEQKNKLGFQGSLAVSYQLTSLLQIQSGMEISKVATHVTVNSAASLPILGSTTSMEKIDQRLLLFELPIYMRLHLRSTKGSKHGFNLFLDAGIVVKVPLTDEASYQTWENGINQGAEAITIKSIGVMSGLGIAIGDNNALTFSRSYLRSNLPKETDVWKLTFTRFFASGE